MEFEEGTIVYLKSGGPAMTVKGQDQLGEIICTWFLNGELKEQSFAASQLTKDNPTAFRLA